MKSELQKKLFKKYPKIFQQRKLPMTQTCMCWGIDCAAGWYDLINALCSHLQWDTDHNEYPQVIATQVKEKYGTLRFYYSVESCTEEQECKRGSQEGKISFAEHLSQYICEQCGSVDGVIQTEGWIVTLCKKCMKKYNKERS